MRCSNPHVSDAGRRALLAVAVLIALVYLIARPHVATQWLIETRKPHPKDFKPTLLTFFDERACQQEAYDYMRRDNPDDLAIICTPHYVFRWGW